MRSLLTYSFFLLAPYLATAQQTPSRPAASPAKKEAPQLVPTTNNVAVSADNEPAPVRLAPRVITGTIRSAGGAPLAGVTVSLRQDERQASITNSEGMFLLRTTDRTPVLHVTYAGYHELDVTPPVTGPVEVELAPIDKYSKQLKKQVKSARKAWDKP